MTDYYREFAHPPATLNSPNEMRRSAQELRQRAPHMLDSNDRDAIVRLAADFDKRADALDRKRSLM
jgi:hypothetical protein